MGDAKKEMREAVATDQRIASGQLLKAGCFRKAG
jgi:hypothetical protein